MKKLLLFVFAGLLSLLLFNSCNKTSSSNRIIPEKSMMLVLKSNTGEIDTQYYENYGKTIVFVQNSPKGRQITIFSDTGVTVKLPYEKLAIKQPMEFDTIKSIFKANIDSITKSKRFKKIGKEEILGYKCDVYSADSGMIKIWVWKNALILKSQATLNFFGQNMLFTTQAVDIKKNVIIPKNYLTIPPDYKVMSYIEYQNYIDQSRQMLQDSMPDLDSINKQLQEFADSLKNVLKDTVSKQ